MELTLLFQYFVKVIFITQWFTTYRKAVDLIEKSYYSSQKPLELYVPIKAICSSFYCIFLAFKLSVSFGYLRSQTLF